MGWCPGAGLSFTTLLITSYVLVPFITASPLVCLAHSRHSISAHNSIEKKICSHIPGKVGAFIVLLFLVSDEHIDSER